MFLRANNEELLKGLICMVNKKTYLEKTRECQGTNTSLKNNLLEKTKVVIIANKINLL